jgi:hypothetical protein
VRSERPADNAEPKKPLRESQFFNARQRDEVVVRVAETNNGKSLRLLDVTRLASLMETLGRGAEPSPFASVRPTQRAA